MSPASLLVITGASGSGKTAIVQALARNPRPGVTYHHFDSVGVPSPAEITSRFGSPEDWQTAWTHKWVSRLHEDPAAGRLAVLEGQMRPGVVADAFRASRVRGGRILLLDCRPEVRTQRLGQLREQPELANTQMMTWAAYLRGQADALHVPTLDTSDLTLDQAADQVRSHVARILASLDVQAVSPEPL